MSLATIVIVGAGHAGISAALSARKAGHDGAIIMIAHDGAREPYERPPLSKWSSETVTRPIFPDELVKAADLTIIDDTVVAIDRQAKALKLATGGLQNYDKLLLATGAEARKLSVPGADQAQTHHLRSVADAKALRHAAQSASQAAIIGGGFIGLELAASFRALGISVHVIEAADRLLARAVSPTVARVVQDLHTANGVSFTFGKVAAQITPGQITLGKTATIILDDGTEVPTDLIVAGIGSVPETMLAEEAGLKVDDGIVVDQTLRTTDPDIYAAGDCCRFPMAVPDAPLMRLESWKMAGSQGDLAARNMIAAEPTSYSETPWFWSEQYNHTLQVAGVAHPSDRHVERMYAPDHHITFSLSETGRLTSASGIAPGAKIAKDIRFAMKLIEAEASPSPEVLSDPDVALKSLLRG